ncbi:hypothetical protein E5288_WYG005420 [Bos mutus]|uniref:Uncharacterized protein n=1 Tax=Bos mutus TaxID=72004 RepID=A0A6B0RLW5_9CETA|nr:hypothetical protein [Bos mutus]
MWFKDAYQILTTHPTNIADSEPHSVQRRKGQSQSLQILTTHPTNIADSEPHSVQRRKGQSQSLQRNGREWKER